VLAEYGLPSTVRQRRGIDIASGCGQLAVGG
jgi:23S rRNA (adenine2503-C2)-methyltransferase